MMISISVKFLAYLFLFFLLSDLLHFVNSRPSLSSSRRILDLSKDIPTAEDWNTSKASVELQNVIQSQFPQVLSYVVVDNGLKVAEFYDSVTGKVNETTLQHAFSVTKSWTSLLIGILQFMNKISVKETLGNIWKDENNSIWPLVKNSNFRKNITVEELLTMTSGCDDPPIDLNTSRYSLEEGTHAGTNLIEVLNYPTCNSSQKGYFNYMNDNILSYVILERSGMRPQQFAGKYLMPYLGMTNTTWEWLKNLDGVAYASAGLSTTTLNYAKFGLLYLQNGFASDGKQIISKAWIDNSTVSHFVPKELPQGWFHVNQSTTVSYGYRFWLFNNRTYCAYGAGGHYVCIWNDLNRVLAVNVAFPSFNYSAWLGYSFVQIVGDIEWATGADKEKEASSSSSLLHTIQVSLTCVIVTLLYMI